MPRTDYKLDDIYLNDAKNIFDKA
ncbi:uncharacterized protein METZ01_LOCUS87918 [marine metagenome]|uniref:Uncharacterized protein n=1 Tax=marine metagenome TaxID=408172 RepID=A0A381V4E7_9ZZZZ